ncbi:MAG: phosphatidylserine decarboxylase [Fusobacterium gastrosuis]|uniref:phosphatidylserine decarboxylase n=1 Tax=Fusobacterium gastrosuis TaxID=1755100 RepID=UPI002A9E28C6|nr:phosphatidylserine decarboxylase [Fusobacteriaceae bacterium]MDY5794910.1 phosphatidylserine decarboxylase [Fusobacterium gastrosuis]
MKFEKIKYIERKTGEIKEEKVMGEGALKFLYYNPFGSLLLNTVVKRKFLSEIYGKKMNKPESKMKIAGFIKEMNIDMNDYARDINEYKSFNDFFYRELKTGARTIDRTESVLVSPADGKILAYENLKEKDKFFVKGSEFTLEEFFSDKELAKKYEDGTFVIVRLAPADYHRFHFPAAGKISETKKIKGYYYSVSTHAIKRNFRIFCENKREYAILSTKKFGDIAMIDVGATMVGSIVQTYKENSFVEKGDEKGYFLFGGSTCILVFEKDKIQVDEDIIENTKNGIETRIYMGEKIAHEKK